MVADLVLGYRQLWNFLFKKNIFFSDTATTKRSRIFQFSTFNLKTYKFNFFNQATTERSQIFDFSTFDFKTTSFIYYNRATTERSQIFDF